MKTCLLSVLVLSCCLATSLPAAELETIENATLIEASFNDGDSFKVKANGKELHLRLYYVDCPETTFGTKAERDRIIEQQYYFGLKEHETVIRFGKQATEYVKRVLSRPFTIYTSYAKAPGRSAIGRHYAFIKTHDGHDLGHLLIKQGLARAHGETHKAPDGTSSKFVWKKLRNLLDFAISKRNGIWKETDPELLLEQRKILWEEDCKWKQCRKCKKKCDTPLDLNTASKERLQELPGIGPVIADAIIAGRPYRCVDDLLNVPGIGPKKLEQIRPCVTVENCTVRQD